MTTKLETMLNELIENLSTAHVNYAELEPIKQEILQEAFKPTVHQLEYCDGEYTWVLVRTYDKEELDKVIADVREYDKTIKNLDFDNDDELDNWTENHPLSKFNDYRFDDLLDIVDDKDGTWANYLQIDTIKVSGVSQ